MKEVRLAHLKRGDEVTLEFSNGDKKSAKFRRLTREPALGAFFDMSDEDYFVTTAEVGAGWVKIWRSE